MEYKKAIDILLKIMKKYSLDSEEKEAILTAIGTLDCGSLIDNRLKRMIKNQKDKRDKNAL
ncbi:MAG TPA: hypothetical protein PLD14_02600 [Candidatus Pacearchaeota archaeon]|nr:hypothetical protein [Candidatus Pacearchaeota archaeon]HPR80091.1 hypothetical protein [Candidatus Pacearchaeota archaeon]